ncbi:hypothetical protein J6590_031588 [Homalodisca vitripennis]|nr:hypothetical protein J6590_031588 [Homalodisca vitripennis]
MTQLVNTSKQSFHTLYNQQYTQVIEKQADKITEMAAVMKMAAEVDDSNGIKDEATIVQLTTENKSRAGTNNVREYEAKCCALSDRHECFPLTESDTDASSHT